MADDLEPFFMFSAADGEEHVPVLLANEREDPGNVNLATDTRVPGRILGHQEVYKDIGADPYIVRMISEGYRLEFYKTPPSSFTKNNRSAREKPDFVFEELLRLEKLGCIARVEEKPTIVLPLSCVYSTKWRLVVDASRTLNPFCTKRKIKLEDLSHVSHTIRRGDFMVCNDLDSGYWHVPVHPDHWQYLGVHFVKEDGTVLYWVWKVLCLGLTDAAYIFTKSLAPLMGELRRRGMRGLIYIDDKWTLGRTKQECEFWENEVKKLFSSAGWIFKPGKRSGDPAQVCRFLGLTIDSRDLTFNIPEDKIEKIERKASDLLSRKFNKVRKIASLVGLLQSVRRATGPMVSVFTRSLYTAIKAAARWESFIRLNEEALFELRWWLENIRSVSKYPIDGGEKSVSMKTVEVASDASNKGNFVYQVDDKSILSARSFTERETKESSTFRELTAFHDVWTNTQVCERFRNMSVHHYTDSKAMMYIIGGGSKQPRLQRLLRDAILNLRKFNITIHPLWISRDSEIIKFADGGSRDHTSDDVRIDYFTFKEAEDRFGNFDVDGFASSINKRCPVFFSDQASSPGSAGTDFFLQRLDRDLLYWLFPPVRHLCETVWKLRNENCVGVLLVPVWPRSSFFSFFFPDGIHLADWVVDVMWTRPYFVCGEQVTNRAFKGKKMFDSVLIKIDFADLTEFDKPVLHKRFCRVGGCEKCE